MTEQNKKFSEVFKRYSLPMKIIFVCLLPALIIHAIVQHFLSGEQKEFWKKHTLGISIGITALMIMILGLVNEKTASVVMEDMNSLASKTSQVEPAEEKNEKTEAEEEAKKMEEEARKVEEEEKARLAEEEKAKKAAEEAERQRQKEAALQEQTSRASAAFANPLGHKGEIIAVTGSITVDYAYKKNDTHKYTDRIPAGTKDGWGGFWIDTQYGKCYAEYSSGNGPKKEYHAGDTITFVGRVVSDESSYEPINGIVAPLWIDATEDF